MAQESLVRKLEEAAGRIKVLEREKNEAVGKIDSLEREANELRSLVSLAESKADEMLKGGPVPELPRAAAAPTAQVSVSPRPIKGPEDYGEPSAAQQEEFRKRFPNAFTSG